MALVYVPVSSGGGLLRIPRSLISSSSRTDSVALQQADPGQKRPKYAYTTFRQSQDFQPNKINNIGPEPTKPLIL